MPAEHYITRRVSVPIYASRRHCSNDCPAISSDAKSCHMFGDLTWDTRKVSHGNFRAKACVSAERQAIAARARKRKAKR